MACYSIMEMKFEKTCACHTIVSELTSCATFLPASGYTERNPCNRFVKFLKTESDLWVSCRSSRLHSQAQPFAQPMLHHLHRWVSEYTLWCVASDRHAGSATNYISDSLHVISSVYTCSATFLKFLQSRYESLRLPCIDSWRKILVTRQFSGHKSQCGRFCYTVTGGEIYLDVAQHFNCEV